MPENCVFWPEKGKFPQKKEGLCAIYQPYFCFLPLFFRRMRNSQPAIVTVTVAGCSMATAIGARTTTVKTNATVTVTQIEQSPTAQTAGNGTRWWSG